MMRKPKQDDKDSDEKQSKTFCNQSGEQVQYPHRRIDLSNLRDVRLELSAVYRKMNSGEIQTQDGTRRAYVLKTIHDVMVSAELERRITELEDRQTLPGSRVALPAPTD